MPGWQGSISRSETRLSFPNMEMDCHPDFNPPPTDEKNFPTLPLEAYAELPALINPVLIATSVLMMLLPVLSSKAYFFRSANEPIPPPFSVAADLISNKQCGMLEKKEE